MTTMAAASTEVLFASDVDPAAAGNEVPVASDGDASVVDPPGASGHTSDRPLDKCRLTAGLGEHMLEIFVSHVHKAS